MLSTESSRSFCEVSLPPPPSMTGYEDDPAWQGIAGAIQPGEFGYIALRHQCAISVSAAGQHCGQDDAEQLRFQGSPT
jgi:hypothetical protein